jgi:hypothetical protein
MNKYEDNKGNMLNKEWKMFPQDIEQLRQGGCRVAWTILRRSDRRDLSSNLSNPIVVYLKKG